MGETGQQTKPRTGSGKGDATFGVVLIFLWLLLVLISPMVRLDRDDLKSRQSALLAVQLEILSAFPQETDYVVDARWGNNLYVYIKKSTFESIPYPHREDVVTKIGKAWCENTSRQKIHWVFLSAVKIRDIRTGDNLSGYSCVLPW